MATPAGARNRPAVLGGDADMVGSPVFIERLVAPMLERGAVGTFTKEIRPRNPTGGGRERTSSDGVWEFGVTYGWLTRRRASPAK